MPRHAILLFQLLAKWMRIPEVRVRIRESTEVWLDPLYLKASRPNIVFSVCLCACFQTNPKESHLKAVKRIFRYLNGTQKFGLWNSDFAGYLVDRNNTSCTCHRISSCLISWCSKKQNCVALSTAETEYIAAGLCCVQILWLKNQLSDFGIKCECVPIFCDNSSTISVTQNPIMHSRTKHIDIRHHFLRDH